MYENGEELLHFWYSGYIEDENGPRYTVTVLREATPDDKGVTAQVFRENCGRNCGAVFLKSTEDALFNQRDGKFFYFFAPCFYLSEKPQAPVLFPVV